MQSHGKKLLVIAVLLIMTCVCLAGVSRVKWSKYNLLATAHDGDIRVWDPRVSDVSACILCAHYVV